MKHLQDPPSAQPGAPIPGIEPCVHSLTAALDPTDGPKVLAGASTLVSWVRAKSTKESSAVATPRVRHEAPRARVCDTSKVLGLALRLLCSRFPPPGVPTTVPTSAEAILSVGTSAGASVADASADVSALLTLLGDVAMVLTNLSLESEAGVDKGVLAGHRPVVCALGWRLFSLFRHGHKDVQRGAVRQWVAVMGLAPWLEREAFGDSPMLSDWQPLHSVRGDWTLDSGREVGRT